MTARLTRFWFEFDAHNSKDGRAMPWVGVTAWTLDDAKGLIREKLLDGRELPSIIKLVEDVKVDELDERHVRRHMEPPNLRGIWYPMGYADR